jgi:hypothetical protein
MNEITCRIGIIMNFFSTVKEVNPQDNSHPPSQHFGMRIKTPVPPGSFWFIVILLILIPQICMGTETNESIAAGKVTVTDVVIDPSVLMTGDVGMVTCTVENTGESNVVISDAHLISKEITVLNSDTYLGSRTIGAGTEMKFSFTILANQPENIYYPAFYLNYKDAGSLRYNIPLRIEEPQLAVSVAGIPETFSRGVTSTITLHLGNAKSVNMTGITIIPSGDGIKCNQTSSFIGNLGPHSEKLIGFDIIPLSSSILNFNISYTCGMNSHYTSYSIPIVPGTDKLAADPVLNNLEVTVEGSGKTLAGDISNTGISDAYGVVVSLQGAVGDDGNPNQKYAIGTISSGDFESFEISIPADLKKVPLVTSYKDVSGNRFTKNSTVDIDEICGESSFGFPAGSGPAVGFPPGSSGGTGSSSEIPPGEQGGRVGSGVNPMNPLSGAGGGMSGLPVMEILIVVGTIIALIITRKIWNLKKKGKKITFTMKKSGNDD